MQLEQVNSIGRIYQGQRYPISTLSVDKELLECDKNRLGTSRYSRSGICYPHKQGAGFSIEGDKKGDFAAQKKHQDHCG
jgi:hypothetical protein